MFLSFCYFHQNVTPVHLLYLVFVFFFFVIVVEGDGTAGSIFKKLSGKYVRGGLSRNTHTNKQTT